MAGVQRGRAGLLGSGGVLVTRDEKTSGTGGGTFTSGSPQTRTLNTTPTNTITGASVASNQITLPAGTYYITASAQAFLVGNHKLRLRNITDSTTTIVGPSNYTGTDAAQPTYVSAPALLDGVFTIAASKAFELQHQCGTTRATSGFGTNNSFTEVEVYAQVTIFKMS